jgi:hypothetical protein
MRITTLVGSIEIPDIEPRRPHPDEALGLALDTVRLTPLNGMRYLPQEGGSGWYLWGGEEMSHSADFFSPIQIQYVSDYIPNILPFLDLPPGFRFETDMKGRQKVWFDGSLLET